MTATTRRKIPVPTLVRLEKLIDGEWILVSAAESLLYPSRYAERLASAGKVGRATELDDKLQPTGRVWTTGTVAHCPICEEDHLEPFDGSCLL